ncbi:hypothetical protein VTK73DRAFT_7504 [Phialemonium thermophilum]|uniref:Uncharacterized protein n=1 Tax=Phialemonium thermophilum TaxID=223376 RepID=A0ABR3WDZ7_9PEZI
MTTSPDDDGTPAAARPQAVPEAGAEEASSPKEQQQQQQQQPATPDTKQAEPASAAQASPEQTAPGSNLLPGEHWVTAAQDLPQDDNDSAFEDWSSSTASVASSIFEYRNILGRTFHSEVGKAQYWGANDEAQNETLDINHHVIKLVLGGKDYTAPLKDDVQKVLDVGTGTGIWAIDFGDEHPSAEVIGTDISPIQPTWVPPNVKFEIEDCNQDWTFAPNSFDYVHIRWLTGSIIDWTELFRRAYRSLKPGGILESHEASPKVASDDGTLAPESAMGQWAEIWFEAGRKMGQSFSIIEDDTQRKAMEDAGFEDIHVQRIKVPIGSWPQDPKQKEIGRFVQLFLEQDLEGHLTFVAGAVLGWSPEQIAVYAATLRRQWRSGKTHAYYYQQVVWGRKPAPPSVAAA